MSPSALSLRSKNVPEKTVSPAATTKLPEKQPFIAPPLSSPIDVLRDVRAYEYDRQRVKKAAELAKTREMKSRNAISRRNHWGPWADKPKKTVIRMGKTGWFLWKEATEGELEKVEQLKADSPPTPAVPKRGEVKLADLIMPQKPRKTKGKTYPIPPSVTYRLRTFVLTGGDFEVIPPPRSVIVLDDFTINDMDLDGSWEHVPRGEDEKRNSLSYAQIVSAAVAK